MELKEGYKQTDLGAIPEDWNITELTSVSVISRLAGAEYTSFWEEEPTGEIIALRGFNIGKGKLIDRELTRISNALSIKLKRSRLCRGDVVYPCVGSIGNAAVIEEDDKYHIQQNIARITPNGNAIDSYFLANYLMSFLGDREVDRFNASSSQPSVLVGSLRQYRVPLPPTKAEQEAIAEALSDADALIASLEQLIAKKRCIKQGAMQELLTGKRRLPGFSGDWEVSSFDEVLVRVNTRLFQLAKTNYQISGRFPVVDQGQTKIIGFSDAESLCYECPTGGVIVFGDHTCITKFIDFNFVVGADGTNILVGRDGQSTRFHAYQLEHKGIASTGYNRHFKFLREREFFDPKEDEQTAIAEILSDMDAEIAALETKLAKARQVKQGMMQELLTGNIRLIQPEKSHA